MVECKTRLAEWRLGSPHVCFRSELANYKAKSMKDSEEEIY